MEVFSENAAMKQIEDGAVQMLGQNKIGFLVPLIMHLRIDYEENDFGVSGHFEMTKEDWDFIMLSEDFAVSGVTQKIYEYCF
jgi:hypothetical protein